MDWSKIILYIISTISLIVSIVLFIISNKRRNFQFLCEQNNLHASDEVFMGTRRLWELYRKDRNSFQELYIEIMQEELLVLNNLPKEKQLEFQRNTLHYQRKLVTQFWRNLALAMKFKLLPEKQAYCTWAKSTVEIIPKVLLPIEKRLAGQINVSDFEKGKEALYYIVDRIDKFY